MQQGAEVKEEIQKDSIVEEKNILAKRDEIIKQCGRKRKTVRCGVDQQDAA
jgi:hypothetical protein